MIAKSVKSADFGKIRRFWMDFTSETTESSENPQNPWIFANICGFLPKSADFHQKLQIFTKISGF